MMLAIGGCLVVTLVLCASGAFLARLGRSQRMREESTGATAQRRDPGEPGEAEAFVICKNFVEQRLKSPSSADFPWFDRSVEKTGPRSFRVVSYVDAQNSFGAKLRTHFQCKLTFQGGQSADKSNWTLDDLTIDQ